MPNNVTAYINYFRQLAVTHSLIKHDPQTESGGGKPTDRKFTIFGNNEVVAGLGGRTLGNTVLCLELYDNTISAENVYDIRQSPKGAFMVINKAKESNFVDEARAYDITETIMYDLLKQIWQHHYGPDVDECDRPFENFKWNMEITPTGKLFNSYYGWYVEFNLDFKNTIDITQPPADGTFI